MRSDGRSAIWGGATLGLIVGLIAGILSGAFLLTIGLGIAVGALAGVAAEVLAAIPRKMRTSARVAEAVDLSVWEAQVDEESKRLAESWVPGTSLTVDQRFGASRYLYVQASRIVGANQVGELERMESAGTLPSEARELFERAESILRGE